MKRVFIVGGNGFARECYMHLMDLQPSSGVEFGGFLGHGGYGHTVDYKSYQHLYKGEVNEFAFTQEDSVIIGAAYPDLRKKIYNDLKKLGLKFYTLLAKGVELPDSLQIGEANFISYPFIYTVDIKIGDGNVFNGGILLGHDVEIGDFNFFGPRSQLLGNVKIGNKNTIGANAILLPHAKIGDNNKIAPLSAVYKGCRNNCYMAGNPALKIGSTENND